MDNLNYKYKGIWDGRYGVKTMDNPQPNYKQYIGLPNIKSLVKKYTADCCNGWGNPLASCDIDDLHYYQPSNLTLQFAGFVGIYVILVGTLDVYDIVTEQSCTVDVSFLGYIGLHDNEFVMLPNSVAQSYGFPGYFAGAPILEWALIAFSEGIAWYVITCGPIICNDDCGRGWDVSEVNASILTAQDIGNDYYLLTGQLDVVWIGLCTAQFVVFEINGLLFIQTAAVAQNLGYDGIVWTVPAIWGVLAITWGSLASGSVNVVWAPEFFFNLTQLKTCGLPIAD